MKKLIISAALAVLLAGCGNDEISSGSPEAQISESSSITEVQTATAEASIAEISASDSDSRPQSYHQISQDEAVKMMAENDGHIIVDVRRQDEFDEGHIPNAVCIPNESITDTKPDGLPDLDQVILVYCRSGRRSKEASQKLADIGYTNIFEFGGIIDWTGEVVR